MRLTPSMPRIDGLQSENRKWAGAHDMSQDADGDFPASLTQHCVEGSTTDLSERATEPGRHDGLADLQATQKKGNQPGNQVKQHEIWRP